MAISKTKIESIHITLQAGRVPKHLDFVLTQELGSINFIIYTYDVQKKTSKSYISKPSPLKWAYKPESHSKTEAEDDAEVAVSFFLLSGIPKMQTQP